MTTVHDLRKMGYTVKVRHDRIFTEPKFGGWAMSPKGGSTQVNIYMDGKLITSGYSKCCDLDNYDRKLGVKIALGRALKGI